MNEKRQRLEKANELITCIASCGHRFYSNKDGNVSRFAFDYSRLYFVDKMPSPRQWIYMHQRTSNIERGFTEGGTLKALMIALRDYILKNKQVPRGHFFAPDWYSNGDPWGYKDDMQIVRNKAIELGIIAATYEDEQEAK